MSDKLNLKGKKVLLIDDDHDFVIQNTLRFKEAGCTVIAAGSQEEARKAFTEGKPDVVILDLMMEEKDAGMVLAHHFKRERPVTPILLVTGITRETGVMLDPSNPETKAWMKADRILSKPVRFEQLVREVEILLAQH